jgi:diadenosine tetraphosphatase ApaH/serine/threonine PP2A family protein phosphatase
MDIFDCLPLAAIVNNSILCVHAGVSTQLKSISDINKINRFE